MLFSFVQFIDSCKELFMFIQYPVLILLVYFSYQCYYTLKIQAFKFIYIGWIINAIGIFFSSLKYEPFSIYTNNLFDYIDNIDMLSRSIPAFFDFANSYFLLKGAAIGIIWENLKLGTFFKMRFSIITLTGFFVVAKIIIYAFELYDFRNYYLYNLPNILFNIITLSTLTIYFYQIVQKYKVTRGWLFYGSAFYCIDQLLFFVNNEHIYVNSDDPIFLFFNSSGYFLGFLSKFLIVFGLYKLFVASARHVINTEEINTKLDSILGTTFHELLEPLTTIDNNLTLLTQPNEKDKNIFYSKKAKKYIVQTEKSFLRVLAIVHASAHLYDRNIEAELEKEGLKKDYTKESKVISINDLLEASRMNFKNILSKERIVFNSDFSRNCEVDCNPYEIIQVFVNIFKNSYEAILEKNVRGTITIKTFHSKLERKEVIVTIVDNGTGIKSDIESDIYTEGVSSKKGSIRGYGLAIIKNLLQKNKGNIHLETIYNEDNPVGTKATITFKSIY